MYILDKIKDRGSYAGALLGFASAQCTKSHVMSKRQNTIVTLT